MNREICDQLRQKVNLLVNNNQEEGNMWSIDMKFADFVKFWYKYIFCFIHILPINFVLKSYDENEMVSSAESSIFPRIIYPQSVKWQ